MTPHSDYLLSSVAGLLFNQKTGAGFGTWAFTVLSHWKRLPWYQRASPSTTLDKIAGNIAKGRFVVK